MRQIKIIVPLFLLFATGCAAGAGISTSQPAAEPDLFATFPKEWTQPQTISWSSGVIEVDSAFYEVQHFDMTLQENPADPNSVKLTIDVRTPSSKPQRMIIYKDKTP